MRHGENHVRLQALHRAPPQQPTPSVVKRERRPAASVKPRQESCVRSSGIVTLLARGPSDSWGGEALLMINHVGVTTVEEDATRGTTTLVYLQLHISLYTGTVHVLSGVAGIHPLV